MLAVLKRDENVVDQRHGEVGRDEAGGGAGEGEKEAEQRHPEMILSEGEQAKEGADRRLAGAVAAFGAGAGAVVEVCAAEGALFLVGGGAVGGFSSYAALERLQAFDQAAGGGGASGGVAPDVEAAFGVDEFEAADARVLSGVEGEAGRDGPLFEDGVFE